MDERIPFLEEGLKELEVKVSNLQTDLNSHTGMHYEELNSLLDAMRAEIKDLRADIEGVGDVLLLQAALLAPRPDSLCQFLEHHGFAPPRCSRFLDHPSPFPRK